MAGQVFVPSVLLSLQARELEFFHAPWRRQSPPRHWPPVPWMVPPDGSAGVRHGRTPGTVTGLGPCRTPGRVTGLGPYRSRRATGTAASRDKVPTRGHPTATPPASAPWHPRLDAPVSLSLSQEGLRAARGAPGPSAVTAWRQQRHKRQSHNGPRADRIHLTLHNVG